MKFQDLWNKFSFLFDIVCDKKTCAFFVLGTGNKIMWAVGGMGWGHQAESVLFVGVCVCECVCVCVCVCGAEGGLGGHYQASNAALEAKYL